MIPASGRSGALAALLALATAGAQAADRPTRCDVWSDQRANPRCAMPTEVTEADRRLNAAWRDLLATKAAAKSEIELLRREQRDWLLRRDKTYIDDVQGLYEDRIAYFALLMRGGGPFDPARREAVFGRYGERVQRCFIDNTCSGWGDSEVFVLPTGDARRARLVIDTIFFNGHSCTLDEVGTYEGDRLIMMIDTWNWQRQTLEAKSCRLTVTFNPGKSITLESPGGCGTSNYCGARGLLQGVYPRWRARDRARP